MIWLAAAQEAAQQAAPAVSGFSIDRILEELLRLGLPGIVIMGLAWFVLDLRKDLKDSQLARIEDIKKMQVALDRGTEAMAAWVPANEARGRALDAMALNTQSAVGEMKNVTAAIDRNIANTQAIADRVDRTANTAIESNVRLREVLLRVLDRIGKGGGE